MENLSLSPQELVARQHRRNIEIVGGDVSARKSTSTWRGFSQARISI